MTTNEDARALDKAAMDRARADWWTPHLKRRDPNAAFDAGWAAARNLTPAPDVEGLVEEAENGCFSEDEANSLVRRLCAALRTARPSPQPVSLSADEIVEMILGRAIEEDDAGYTFTVTTLRKGATAVHDRITEAQDTFDLVAFLIDQRAASVVNFGPGERTAGVCNHIRKELAEIEDVSGSDPVEWMDVVILAFNGAMRAGHEPADLIRAWQDKQALNQTRKWPDWRALPLDAPIEHVRDASA